MKIFYNVVQGLALYYVLFNAIFLIGGKRFWTWITKWEREGKTTVPWIYLSVVYAFGAIGTGFVLDFARSSGQWYALPAGVMKILFAVLLPVVVVLRTKSNKKVKDYIENHFRLNLFLLFGSVLGFGCVISFILIHLVKLGLS